MTDEPIFFVRLTDQNRVNSNNLVKYMDQIMVEVDCGGSLYAEYHSVTVSTTEKLDLQSILERILEDFMTDGENCEELVDIYGLDVYISDPELSSMYLGRRANINRNHNAMMCDIMIENVNDLTNTIDSIQLQINEHDNVMYANGISHMRKIVGVIVNNLMEASGSNKAAMQINEITQKTVH